MDEIKLIKMLDHPNTIKVIEVFQSTRELQIVMEMCTGGELFDRLYQQPKNRFSEGNCKRLFKQMLKSLAYIHGMHTAVSATLLARACRHVDMSGPRKQSNVYAM